MSKNKFLSLIIFVLFPLLTFSQVKISGRIIDNKNNPIQNAEILIIGKDSTALKSELSDASGHFLINAEKAKYNLVVRYFSQSLFKRDIDITSDINLDVIKIEIPEQLQEITISKKKKLIDRKVDRLVFNVENSISAMGGDGIDALKVTPSLRIQNDQISIIGKSGMNVMINDRFIQLSGEDLINYLKNIKSDDIKKIEVITNPPAKYDAQGNSGLINIVTKTVKSNSYNGSARTSLSQSKKSIGTTGINLNYQQNKLTLTSNLSYSNGSKQPYQKYTLTYPTYTWVEENNKSTFTNNTSGGFTIDYKVSNKTKIGGEYTLSHNLPLVKTTNNSSIYNKNTGQIDSIIKNRSRIEMKKNTNAINFYSITELDTLGRKINFNVDYLNYKSNTENDFNSNSFYPDNTEIPNRYLSANNLSNQKINIITSKLDFEYPTKWANFSFGTKISFINNDSKVNFYETTTGSPVFDETKSNVFNYKENVQSLYFSGNKKLTDKLEIQFGLRGENTQTTGFSKTLNQTNKNNYFKIFPTLFLNYVINENKTLSLNYNKRINRPSYGNLNPFRFYSTKFNYSEGNPFLQPFLSNNIELSYTYKSSYTSFYVYTTKNGFDQVTYVDPNSIIQIVKPNNFYNEVNFGIFQGYAFNIKKRWENNSNVSVFYSKTNSNIPNIVPDISSWSANINSQNSFILDKDKRYRAELSLMYQFPSVSGSYEVSSFYEVSAGFKTNFFSNKLQLSANVTDIFKSNKQTFSQSVNNIQQEKFDYADIRRIRLSLVYNFGKKFKIDKKEYTNTEEKNRIQ